MTPGFLLLEISSCVGINQECHNYTCIIKLKTKYKLYSSDVIRFFQCSLTFSKRKPEICTGALIPLHIRFHIKLRSTASIPYAHIYAQNCRCLFLTDCNIGVKWVESISKEISMMYAVSTCALWWGAIDVPSWNKVNQRWFWKDFSELQANQLWFVSVKKCAWFG